jgi:hypothetical protein
VPLALERERVAFEGDQRGERKSGDECGAAERAKHEVA